MVLRSEADRLTDDATRHWTHREHSLVSLIRIDGKTQRLMGNEPKDVAAMPQVSVQVLPTRSIYEFDDSHVHVTLTFMTPVLPDDLDLLSRQSNNSLYIIERRIAWIFEYDDVTSTNVAIWQHIKYF